MTYPKAQSTKSSQPLKRIIGLFHLTHLAGPLSLLLASTGIAAPTSTVQRSNHLQHNASVASQAALRQPTEAGQGAFATITEIVQLLQNDPATNWSKVDISALQSHLLDMQQVTLQTKVSSQYTANQVIFTVQGSGDTVASIQAMVPAHIREIATTTPWQSKVQNIASGVILQMTAEDTYQLQKLKALGFYGVMATGAHHQAHHFLLAKGTSAHAGHN